MRPFVTVLLLAGCTASMRPEEKARYPHHREGREQRIEQLGARVGAPEKRVSALQQRLAPPPAAPPPAAPGS
jgi:hypothetical protein